MRLLDLVNKVRVHARDFTQTIFRKEDIVLFINEGIDRFIQVLPQMANMPYLLNDEDVMEMIPREYVHLLTNYAVARLFAQDERHYEASTMMNEFEVKLEEFRQKVENGEIVVNDPSTGEPISVTLPTDYVRNNYFFKRGGKIEGVTTIDFDEGVEGVE